MAKLTPPRGLEVPQQVLVAMRRVIPAIDVHSRYLIHRYGLTCP